MIDAPQPLIRRTEAWQHQARAYQFAYDKRAVMLALEMGCGKSKVAIDLLTNWDAQKVLILCPTAVRYVWGREFSTHGPSGLEVTILDRGTVAEKTAAACRATGPIVVNYESAWRPPFAAWAAKQRWDAVVCDESHRIKAHGGRASKFATAVGKLADRRLCLTGTPFPHSPLDIFAQYRFLDASIFGKYWTHFRSRYAICNPQFPSQVTKWINQDELEAKYHSIAYRVTAREVLDLPETIHETRSFRLGPKAASAYRQLEEQMVARIEAGEITASNALVVLLRLQQLTGGAAVLGDGQQTVELDTGKQELLADLVEDIGADEPIVVFCRFRHDLESVRRVAEKLGRRYGEISGTRRDLTNEARMPAGIQVMGVQMQSGGVGIDLTRAAYCVYYSLGFSLGDYEQSLARVHRPGQSRTTRYYHLVAEGTIDEVVYAALRKRKQVVDAVLEGLNLKKQRLIV